MQPKKRSLIGTSMRARKHAARQLATSALGVLPAGTYWLARVLYQVGQKVRPCRGCAACRPEMTCTVRKHIMDPWGWPVDAAGMFTSCRIADGTPCRLLHEGRDAKIVIGTPAGGRKRVYVEWQYMSATPTRICDGSGALTQGGDQGEHERTDK